MNLQSATVYVPGLPPATWHARRLPGEWPRVTAFRPDGKLPDNFHDDATSQGRIRCPACQWQPDAQSRWYCISMGPPENFSAGCGHGWNTFDTAGLCPSCLHQWQYTTCLKCHATSPHDDWYVAGKP